jgi:serine/threonine protein kinase
LTVFAFDLLLNPDTRPDVRDAFIQELIILWRLRDEPNIARFFGFSENPSIILMKYYADGSLSDLIHNVNTGPLQIDVVETIALGLITGIQAINALGFAHCDIKVRSCRSS